MSSSSRSSDSGHSSQGSEASSSFDCRTRRRRPHGAATSGAGVEEPIARPISALSALSSRTAVPSSRQQLSDALARLHLDLDAAPLLRAAAESLAHDHREAHIWTLESSEVNSSYADSYTADLLSNPDRFFTSTSSEKVIFYQSFILQWQLKPVHSLPNTITSCKKVLRTVNVNIAELLSVMRSGGSLTSVPMYRNKTLLRASITNGKRAPLKTAKREMLQPFLVQVNFA
ncbi:BZ3500_MvSof-1268-A1-R1_Chr2-2g05019 [Microbotryum saponariae]|uniref:BZ3500_MvSof-1268-A1-R1_Chr2-2g05019 protein n=1 Tax=Microbotryum saponariae TaxID=289078 RepID=A0A2X0KWX5_9BASI|nr:BZ3500_MvSof-1268-A1-R1_Chr2-2g05019 [Microbotryum saponariae]SDA00714.1 BZ3501_MvSof-1269-A2-R1_Chr2-2g04693 [Microbotryum saponariae]